MCTIQQKEKNTHGHQAQIKAALNGSFYNEKACTGIFSSPQKRFAFDSKHIREKTHAFMLSIL